MATFEYKPYVNPFAGTIGDLMQRGPAAYAAAAQQIGEAQARAAIARGNAWGGAAQQIGQSASSAVQQATDPKKKLEALQVQQATGQVADAAALRAGQGQVDTMMAGDQLPAGDAGPRAPSFLDANGMFDIGKMSTALAQSGKGHLAPELLKGAEQINDSLTAHQALVQKTGQAQTLLFGDMADGAIKLAKAGGMSIPDAMDVAASPALATKALPPQQYAQVRSQIAALPPEQQAAALGQFMDAASKISGGKTLAKDAVEVDRYNRPIASNKVPDKPTTASLAADAATLGTPQETPTAAASDAALKRLKPAPNATAEQDDQRYRNIQAQLTQHIPVAPPDLAWAGAYEKQKTLSVDRTAGAAADRQAAAITQSTDQQRRAQDFNVAQVARKDLTAGEKTYTDAQGAANMLRDTVDAAKGGNKIAASMQSLQTAMASVKASGFNRINMAEIGIPGTAGSFLDSLQAKFGKLTEGQPVPADLQNDMLKFADLLEKTAYQKYATGFDGIAKYYNLNDQQKTLKLPAPGAAAAPAITLSPGLAGLAGRK